jgi:hypothetical protein
VNLRDLLCNLRGRGVSITAHGLEIEVHGPRAVLTPELVRAIRNRKQDLIALLAVEVDEAATFLDRLSKAGVTFEIVQDRAQDVLVWFASPAVATPEVRAAVARLKPGLIALLNRSSFRQRMDAPTPLQTPRAPRDCE